MPQPSFPSHSTGSSSLFTGFAVGVGDGVGEGVTETTGVGVGMGVSGVKLEGSSVGFGVEWEEIPAFDFSLALRIVLKGSRFAIVATKKMIAIARAISSSRRYFPVEDTFPFA